MSTPRYGSCETCGAPVSDSGHGFRRRFCAECARRRRLAAMRAWRQGQRQGADLYPPRHGRCESCGAPVSDAGRGPRRRFCAECLRGRYLHGWVESLASWVERKEAEIVSSGPSLEAETIPWERSDDHYVATAIGTGPERRVLRERVNVEGLADLAEAIISSEPDEDEVEAGEILLDSWLDLSGGADVAKARDRVRRAEEALVEARRRLNRIQRRQRFLHRT